MKVRFGEMISALCKVNVMRMSRWSNERSCSALYVDLRARSGEAKEIPGKFGWCLPYTVSV